MYNTSNQQLELSDMFADVVLIKFSLSVPVTLIARVDCNTTRPQSSSNYVHK